MGMGFLTGAMAFGQIVSLVGLFRQERRAGDIEDFREWLEEHNFDEVKEQLSQNKELVAGVEDALSEDHDEIMEKLDGLYGQMAALSESIEGLDSMARTLPPENRLSDQAKNILQQLIHTGAPSMTIAGSQVRTTLLMENDKITPENEQFLQDDLSRLRELGLVREGVSSSGDQKFMPTRRGKWFVENMEE